MKVFAASVIEKTGGFLHAGYISSSPREMNINIGPLDNAKVQIDVAQALQLKGEAIAGLPQTLDTGSIANSMFMLGHWPLLLLTTAGFFTFIGLLYIFKDRWKEKRPIVTMALIAILSIAFTITCGSINTTPPWKDLTLKEYESPEAATFAILHGILGPAAENGNMHDLFLATVQDEVALPTSNLTPGMKYALQTYGVDGWGREFRITGDEDFQATSAGKDGKFDTEDDIKADFYKRDKENFDEPSAIFLLKHNNSLFFLFHRFNGSLFEYHHEDLAKEISQNEHFDCVYSSYFSESLNKSLELAYNKVSEGKNYNPIILYVFN